MTRDELTPMNNGFDPEMLKEVQRLNNVKPPKVMKMPRVPPRGLLKEFNEKASRKRRREKVHNTIFDIITLLSFALIVAIAAKELAS